MRRELHPQVLAAIKGVKEEEALTSKEIAKLINIDFEKRDNSADKTQVYGGKAWPWSYRKTE